MRGTAIVSFAQAEPSMHTTLTPVEMLQPVIAAALEQAGIERSDVGFWCHGSCDYMSGQPFSFVAAVDAIGAWPPVIESHVESDGAWAFYEAWVKLQTGECDVALVFANGKSTSGDASRIMSLQLDPYVVAPLWPGGVAVAGLQARAALDTGVVTAESMAGVVARSRRDASSNPYALVRDERSVDELLSAPVVADPFRAHDLPPPTDGAAAVVLAAADVARRLCERPALIRAIDHRIDVQNLGARDLTVVPSAALAGHRCGVGADKVDVAEIHAPFSHEELLLARALGIDVAATDVNPSGGALCANPIMAAGLVRLAEAARRILEGTADRAVAHATQGPCLQHNLVCVMEGG